MDGSDEGRSWQTDPALWEKLKPLTQQKRVDPTEAEDIAWQRLRDRRMMGYRFRRQHPVERFIVDFYCSEARLIIEIDGEIHQYTQIDDIVRQEFLEAQNFTMLCFTNEQVLTELPVVMQKIITYLKALQK